MEKEKLILDYMEVAKRVALKYAIRHGRHIDEAVAEAYFQICLLFLERFPIYEKSEQKDRLVAVFVKRALIKYFERAGSRENRQLIEKINANMDEEMIDWLSGLFHDDAMAFQVYQLIRAGVSLDTIEVTDPWLTRVAKRLKLAVSGRLKRLEMLKAAGLRTTRDVKKENIC